MTGRPAQSPIPLPDGKRVREVLPQFAEVRDEIHIGTPAPNCAGCREPFNAARKRTMNVRLYPLDFPVPIAFAYCLCEACAAKYRRGGDDRAGVAAAVQAFHLGDDSSCA